MTVGLQSEDRGFDIRSTDASLMIVADAPGASDSEQISVDVVIPLFNERECLDELIQRLMTLRLAAAGEGLDIRAILVDDGSTDGSSDLLRVLTDQYDWLAGLHLVRNFGHQAAVTAGLDASTADYVAIVDADLQDPPELIPLMLERLRSEGVQVVYGVRRSRPGDSWFKRRTALGFYRVLRWTSGVDIPVDTGDFRVVSRPVVDALRQLPEHHRLMRALIPWLGFSGVGFEYDRHERFAGRTKYPLRKMVMLATHAVFSFSTFPVRLVQALGVFLTCASLTGLVTLAAVDLGSNVQPGAGAWIATGMVGQTGLLLGAIGLVGGYVFRIQDEVKRRPLYVRHGAAVGEREPLHTLVIDRAAHR